MQMNVKSILLSAVLMVSSTSWALSQQSVTWQQLAQVQLVTKADPEGGLYSDIAFTSEILALDGKEIEIRGYVLPLDAQGETYALSAFPFAACFFCGGAGKESVMMLWLDKPGYSFTLDDLRTFRGKLKLVEGKDNPAYILENAAPTD
ncbi:DUF3299 domain-containing protein [Pontibacter sp. G13]|uniref:DUF3299 domain-containing protein n=1 Tax=Pontibacter sp. G13 TaxID=3074898 RepID=UPI002889653C|nr:DUF3299 domain-containing protein [Pontibacter sp. G13]WNJ20613.1 DUF3299 domain-containing protein [Pontibacter sp. G13]